GDVQPGERADRVAVERVPDHVAVRVGDRAGPGTYLDKGGPSSRAPCVAGSWRAQNSVTERLNSTGRSRLLACPAPGITTSSTSGIDCSNSCAMRSGDRTSCAPQISKVGTPIQGRTSHWSAPAIARSATPTLSGRTPA